MSFITLKGKIITGRKSGRKIGFPTVNIALPRSVKKTEWGIYFSLNKIDDKYFPGVTHLGPPKTFSINRATCETYLLTLKKDLYNKTIEKKLIFKIREIEKFSSTKELKKQIKKDIKKAKKFFGI